MKFAHYLKSGDITFTAPQTNEGLKVYDGSGNKKVLIGKIGDNEYGAEIIDGKIYSSLFRTCRPNVGTSYIELSQDESGGQLKVIGPSGQPTITLSSHTDQGELYFLRDGEEYGQILIGANETNDFNITASGFNGIVISTLFSDEEISLGPVHGDTNLRGVRIGKIQGDLLPRTTETGYVGGSYYKWYGVYAKYVNQGDICFEERACPVCEQPFSPGDTISLLVKTIHETHGTMCVPIHDRCKQISKTITYEVPDTEIRYRLKEDGTVESYVATKFEEVVEQVYTLKENYKLDETTGEFKKVIKSNSDFKEYAVSKEEATEIINIKRRKPATKTATLTLGSADNPEGDDLNAGR